MEGYEREFLDRLFEYRSANIAGGLRDGVPDEEALESRDRLTSCGRMWVRGYLTCRLSMIRGSSTGNPNLSADDLKQIAELVDAKQQRIAAELYA